MKTLSPLLAACGLLAATTGKAEWNIDLGSQARLRISGFGTLGLATSDQAHHALTRDIADQEGISSSSLPLSTDSRLGMQIDAVINPQWSATVQAVLKDRPAQTIEESLQWAFISYRPNANWQLRAGRVGLDMGLVSDQRNIGYSYLWVRPPIEFYGRLPLFHFNGGDVSYSFDIDDVSLSIKAFAGEASPFYPSTPNYKIQIAPLWGGNINLRWQDWHAQLSYVGTQLQSNHPGLQELQSNIEQLPDFLYPDAASLSSRYTLRGSQNHFLSAGLAYEGDPWRAQFEFGRLFHGNGFIADVYMAYATVGYRLGSVTPFIGYSTLWPANGRPEVSSPLPFPDLQAAAERPFAESYSNQETISLGGRWDFYNNLALKLQYDLVHVRNSDGIGLWRTDQAGIPQPQEFSNMFSATLDFVF